MAKENVDLRHERKSETRQEQTKNVQGAKKSLTGLVNSLGHRLPYKLTVF